MEREAWACAGIICCSLGLAACVGNETPPATPADFGAPPSADGWSISNTFGDVSLEAFEAGDFVIVPLKAVSKQGAERFDTRRSAYVYAVDAPNPNADVRERYLWGSAPTDNGHGTFHYYYERLAFDLRAHRVFILPRGGSANVDQQDLQPARFWCNRDALREATVDIVGYGPVCPTAFIRTTGDTKGPPLLVGLQKEQYIIDTRFIAGLIHELQLDEAVKSLRASENMNRELAKTAAAQGQQQRAQELERARTAGTRGQAMIDQGDVGSLLCADIHVGDSPAVVSAFLEGVRGTKVQLRVNNIRSPDGRTTFTLKAPIEGIDYTQGGIVWVDREHWRACE
jgi:hypothetical protein